MGRPISRLKFYIAAGCEFMGYTGTQPSWPGLIGLTKRLVMSEIYARNQTETKVLSWYSTICKRCRKYFTLFFSLLTAWYMSNFYPLGNSDKDHEILNGNCTLGCFIGHDFTYVFAKNCKHWVIFSRSKRNFAQEEWKNVFHILTWMNWTCSSLMKIDLFFLLN